MNIISFLANGAFHNGLSIFDGFVHIFVALVAVSFSIYSYRIYSLSGKKSVLELGFGFLLLSLSYLVWSLINFTSVKQLRDFICLNGGICSTNPVMQIMIYGHTLLMLLGLLIIVSLNISKQSRHAFFLLFFIIFSVMVFTIRPMFFFYLLSSILMIYAAFVQVSNYFRTRNKKALVIAASFALLTAGNIEFIRGFDSQVDFTLGNIAILFAYILLITVIRKKDSLIKR